MRQPKRRASREKRKQAGGSRSGNGKAGDEATLGQLIEQAGALRRTGEVLSNRMTDLAARLDAALARRDPRERR